LHGGGQRTTNAVKNQSRTSSTGRNDAAGTEDRTNREIDGFWRAPVRFEREIMNGNEILRLVDALHRDKNIEAEIVFDGIEQAIISAARKHFGEECEVVVAINREDGQVSATIDDDQLNTDEIGELLGRIAAQTAKQVMIQKIREAERDSLHVEYSALKSQIMTGTISRVDGGSCTVNLGKVEGILPRGEQIPGEYYRTGERVRAVIMDVRNAGSRVKIILSRAHPDLVRRLFELEIPEVAEHVIEVRSLAREAGYRSKVAVSCIDSKIDCIGACVGVRGARIRSIVDELAGERIDIVRWNDSLQVLVPNALQPAEVEDVILCPMLGKVIVLVHEEQLSLAIGKKGQNVRLASKLIGWDIHVMTQEKLDVQLDVSVSAFAEVPCVNDELAESLVAQGFFTFDDLSVIEPDQLAELGGLTGEECDKIVAYADVESARIEVEEQQARQEAYRKRQLEAALAEAGTLPPADESTTPEPVADTEPAVTDVGEVADNESQPPPDDAVSVEEPDDAVSVEEPDDAVSVEEPDDAVSVEEAETVVPEAATELGGDSELPKFSSLDEAKKEATGEEEISVGRVETGDGLENHADGEDETLSKAEASAADE